MTQSQQLLTIHAEHLRDAYVIRIEGGLDSVGCVDLEAALGEAERTAAGRIVLDLEELTFIDSAGLETVLKASRRSAKNGNRLQLTRGHGHPADMFRLTMLDLTLPFTELALGPAIRDAGSTPRDREAHEGRRLGRRARPADDANLPRMGEPFVSGSAA